MTTPVDTTNENQRIGLEVRSWMARKELRQADIAEVLGFAQRNVSRRLRGEMPFRIDELLVIARFMEISLSELLGEGLVNEKNPHPVGGGLGSSSGAGVAVAGLDPATSRL